MKLSVTPAKGACGAAIEGLDLTSRLSAEQVVEIRKIWLEHHVVAFPGQNMSDDDLERFTLYFGNFGNDPFIAPIKGREHIIAICREADETAPLFAENWHTDWSFQVIPPAGTCLFGINIPPTGGDTLFANQHEALRQMPDKLRARIEGKNGIHSAAGAYAPDGSYGEEDKDAGRSMTILPSEDARKTHKHPLIRNHPETNEEGLFGCIGYIMGIEDMEQEEAISLLVDLLHWQTREEFLYRHHWEEQMLVMWDNRSVLHSATGGYEGHVRLLHRTTVADKAAA